MSDHRGVYEMIQASKEQGNYHYSFGSLLRLLFSWLCSKHWELKRLEKQIAELTELSTIDYLTGALNRRGADMKLMEQISLTQRNLKGMLVPFPQFSVIAIDLDRFKQVNDVFGHDAGDRALVIVVEITKTIFKRDTDIICRSSDAGDEFLIIVETPLDQAMIRAEMFRKAVEDDARLHFKTFNVTASVGVAAMKLVQTSRQEEIKAAFHNAKTDADYAAIHSKEHGRNAVTKSDKP